MTNEEDKSYENESASPSPMVQISIKEYDKLKEHQKYINFSQRSWMDESL